MIGRGNDASRGVIRGSKKRVDWIGKRRLGGGISLVWRRELLFVCKRKGVLKVGENKKSMREGQLG